MEKYTITAQPFILTTDKNYVFKVMDLPEDSRPREKLIKNGAKALCLSELLAIVLGTGTKKEEVMTMATRLLREYGEKTIVNQTSPEIISQELNLPITKACQIVACFELGKRLFQKRSEGLTIIRSARQAFDYLTDMRNLNKEQFRALYLNNRYQLIHDEVISVGTINASLVEPRDIFRPAIQYSASAIIIAHNHPSGEIRASAADLDVTAKLVEAGKMLNIEVLDHLIIAQNKYLSII